MAKVTMFVTNPVRGDNRVLKEARALQDEGHDVLVLGRWVEGAPREDLVDGVRVRLVGGDQRYRMRKADRYNARRKEMAGVYDKWRNRIASRFNVEGLEPGIPTDPSEFLTKAAKIGLIQTLRFGYRVKLNLMGSKYRMESTLLWKFEPLTSLRDWEEAITEIGDEIRAEIWHAHDLDTLPAALECKKRFGGKVIYDAHEYWLDCNNEYSPFAKKLWGTLERRLIREADAVITVSESIAKVLANEYGVDKPDVVLNAPDFAEAERTDYLRKTLGIPKDQLILIYVGLVTQERGYEILMRALKPLESVQLVCLGPGHAEYKTKLAEQARELGIGDRIHFLPPVPVAEIQKVTASADAGLVVVQRNALSYELCLPSKFFEYIFAGIPVAVSDLVELRPLVEEFGLGVCFDETNEASISNAIEDLLRRKNEFTGSRWDEVRHRVARQYAWNERKKDLVQVYERLVGPVRRVPS